jgi:hypothetical protein
METNNMNTRARFEEIWPVPEGVYWIDYPGGGYYAPDKRSMYEEIAEDWNGRLQVFTRCQEMTPMVGVIVDDLIRELDNAKSLISDGYTRARITCTIENAKQIMGYKK